MSTATEFPPLVYVPERARHGSSQGAGASRVRHLRLVDYEVEGERGCELGGGRGIAQSQEFSGGGRVHSERVASPKVAGVVLTRKGRLAVAMAAVLVGVCVAALGVASAPDAHSSVPAAVPSTAPATVVVAHGDTLWSIVTEYETHSDPRDAVARIRDLNHLSGVDLQPGTVLRLR